jgi:hypothetical protein
MDDSYDWAAHPPQCNSGELRLILQFPEDYSRINEMRQMEYANSLLCTLHSSAVSEVLLLQEHLAQEECVAMFRRQVAKLANRGNPTIARYAQRLALDECKKLKVNPLGARIKYIDIVRLINSHPEWAGKPVLATNADISVSSGFDDQALLAKLVSNNRVMAIRRYENRYCHLLGDYYQPEVKSCHCSENSGCFDSYLMTYPLPRALDSLGFTDGIDFYMGGAGHHSHAR